MSQLHEFFAGITHSIEYRNSNNIKTFCNRLCTASFGLQVFTLGLYYFCPPNLCVLLCIVKLSTDGVQNISFLSLRRRMFEEGLTGSGCLLRGQR